MNCGLKAIEILQLHCVTLFLLEFHYLFIKPTVITKLNRNPSKELSNFSLTYSCTSQHYYLKAILHFVAISFKSWFIVLFETNILQTFLPSFVFNHQGWAQHIKTMFFYLNLHTNGCRFDWALNLEIYSVNTYEIFIVEFRLIKSWNPIT